MLKFARNKVVNIVAKGDDRLLVHGVLDDDIYSCEINFEVQRPEMIIKALEGRWHRYTTPDCPRALDALHPAVGRCIGDPDFPHFINKAVGRKGCEHFANLIIEGAAAALEAELVLNWQQACQSDPDLDLDAFVESLEVPATGATAGSMPPAAEPTAPQEPAKPRKSNLQQVRPYSGGFVVDLHVHTYPASACATDAVDEMIQEAKRIGLNAICITDHNFVWSAEQMVALRRKHDFDVFRGNEITTDQGDMVVFGFYEDIKGIISIEELHGRVAAAGGVMIAAHPFRGFRTFSTDQLGLTPEKASQRSLFQSVDALEVMNGKVTPGENDFARRVAIELALPGTGGSDAHAVGEVGQYATEFDTPIHDEEELVAALRSGQFHAVAYRHEIEKR